MTGLKVFSLKCWQAASDAGVSGDGSVREAKKWSLPRVGIAPRALCMQKASALLLSYGS